MKFTSSQDYNGNNDGNRWQVMVGMRGLNAAPYGKGWGTMSVDPAFVSEFKSGDTRRSASIIDWEAEGITSLAAFGDTYRDQREYTGYTIKNILHYVMLTVLLHQRKMVLVIFSYLIIRIM